MVPAQTQIERQALGDFEGILHEQAQLAIGLGAPHQRIQARALKRQPQQKIGVAESAQRAIEGEAAIASIRNQGAVGGLRFILAAHL